MNLPTLYKLDNNGTVRQWRVWVEDDEYFVEHGVLNGSLQETSTIAEAKNTGRANETTAEEQAELEAKSLWTKQKDRKGYSEDISPKKKFSPMLAQRYDQHPKKIILPCFCQPKLDGLKLIVFNNQCFSRTGKEFKTLDHIKKAVSKLNLPKDTVLDGELYSHDYHDDFQTFIGLVKRGEPLKETKSIQYHIYDVVKNESYKDRYKWLTSNITECNTIKLVKSHLITDSSEVSRWHSQFVSEGYEGAMLRNLNGVYEVGKRSYNLQKVKQFDDDEFEIVGAEENKGKQVGECTILCKTKDGKVFGAKPKGNEQQRRQYWKNFQNGKLVKQFLTVRYFGKSNDGIPRFPVGLSIRNYE